MSVQASARSLRLGDPLRRSFLDELRRRVPLPRPLAAEWAVVRADLVLGVIEDDRPLLVLAAGALDGDRRWLLRQPLDDFETGDLVWVRARELVASGRTPEDAHALAGQETADLVVAIADALDRLAVLRPEQASIPRTLAEVVRHAVAWLEDVDDEPQSDTRNRVDPEERCEREDGGERTPIPVPGLRIARPRRARKTGAAAIVLGLLVVSGLGLALGLDQDTPSEGAEQEQGPTAPTMTEATASAAVATDYSVQLRNPDGSPVRFDPCGSYEYVVQPGSLQAEDAAAEAGAAFAALEEATGVTFRFAGFSGARFPHPLDAAHLPRLPILVSFERAADSRALRDGSHDHGIQRARPLGGLAVGTPVQVRPDLTVIVGGAVVIDENLEPDQRARILLHELGHLAGLGHARNQGQMMAPAVPDDGPTAYRDGDRAGLTELGVTASCALTPAERATLFA